jgi:hypothetical protein
MAHRPRGALATARWPCPAPPVVVNPFHHARQPPSLFGSFQRTPALQRLPQRLPFRGCGHPLQSCEEAALNARCRDRLAGAGRRALLLRSPAHVINVPVVLPYESGVEFGLDPRTAKARFR